MSVFKFLERQPGNDYDLLDTWIHSNGRKVFTRYLAELSANLGAAVANVDASKAESLELYALNTAEKSGHRKGVLDVIRLLEITLPEHYKKQRDKE
jgi:hypothetical protein